jgi:hypothetical protein
LRTALGDSRPGLALVGVNAIDPFLPNGLNVLAVNIVIVGFHLFASSVFCKAIVILFGTNREQFGTKEIIHSLVIILISQAIK